MMSELISARLGTAQPEDTPALAGSTPPKAGSRRPLQDQDGRPLLPRVAKALQAGETLQKLPAAPTVKPVETVEEPPQWKPQVDALSAPLDPTWIASGIQRGLEIRGEQMGRVVRRFVLPVWHRLHTWADRARARRDLQAMLALYGSTGGQAPWADVGGSRGQMLAEASKPFWRA